MRKSKTHFEQIPVEVVKKIAQQQIAKKKKDAENDVIVEDPARKTEPYSIRPHSL
ncbi:MAG TPA: hypothetical protein VEV41_19445 [Terriglobales bacterium]|nr:hypothetical protein [Terriglobales bacterium]